MDLCAAFDRFGREQRDASREERRQRRQLGSPRFKARRRATRAFALWNDQFDGSNHFRFDARPRSTMRMPLLGEVRLREAVPGIGSILGCRVSERRGRWYASFGFDTDWNDGERFDKAEVLTRAKKVAAAEHVKNQRALTAQADGAVVSVSDADGPNGAASSSAAGRSVCFRVTRTLAQSGRWTSASSTPPW